MHVNVMHVTGVDLLAQYRIALVRRPKADRIGLGQLAVGALKREGSPWHTRLA
jgi:hypothetical protein